MSTVFGIGGPFNGQTLRFEGLGMPELQHPEGRYIPAYVWEGTPMSAPAPPSEPPAHRWTKHPRKVDWT